MTRLETSHVDQLAIILRYVKIDDFGEVHERFICFEPAVGHSGKDIAEAILKKLEEFDLNILNARGQSYDNASNMSGKFEGIQAHLKKSNKYMDFIPCTALSLNLVGNNTVENCSVASMFF